MSQAFTSHPTDRPYPWSVVQLAPWTVDTAPAGTGKSTRLAQHAERLPKRQSTLLIMNASDLGEPGVPGFNPYLSGLASRAGDQLRGRRKKGLTILRLWTPEDTARQVKLLRQALQMGFHHYLIDAAGTALIRETPELLEAATAANHQGAALSLADSRATHFWESLKDHPQRQHLLVL